MKKVTLIFTLITGLFLLTNNLFAQTGTALTKQETINYLNKKAQEVIDHYRSIMAGDGTTKLKFYYIDNTVSIYGDNITFELTRSEYKNLIIDRIYYPCDYYREKHEYIFNPAHIVKIEKGESIIAGEPVGIVKITLKSNTGKKNIYWYETTKIENNEYSRNFGKCYDFEEVEKNRVKESVNEVFLTYLQSDDTNFNKIKKALEHIRDLSKAEEDPFAE